MTYYDLDMMPTSLSPLSLRATAHAGSAAASAAGGSVAPLEEGKN